MKWMHVLFDDYPYISSWGYQENGLIAAQRELRHEVTVLTISYVPKVLKGYLTKEDLAQNEGRDASGTKIVRMKNHWPLSDRWNSKVKWYAGFGKLLEAEKPDAIFVHDLHALSLLTLGRYVRRHPGCFCVADLHVNYFNSGRGKLSKYVLHGILYAAIIAMEKKTPRFIFYPNEGTRVFARERYRLNDERRFRLLPLGGTVADPEEIARERDWLIEQHGFEKTDIVFIHSGKLTPEKKTDRLIDAFLKVPDERFRLMIIGEIPEENRAKLTGMMARSDRIHYLGWKSASELKRYLNAGDVYVQPGTPSITLNEAMCSRCAIMVHDARRAHYAFIPDDAAFFIDDEDAIADALRAISKDSECLKRLQMRSCEIATELFDYRGQARMLDAMVEHARVEVPR
jgi:1,2-diacylglycerol 3-alpha-glucosyltransferase